jgi:hypothetical protein
VSRATILARGRAAAEAGMADTCTITRVGTRTTDTTTGDVTSPTTTLYTGPCRIQQKQAQAQREDAGEDHLLLLRLEVQLPVAGTEGLKVGDRITVTAAVNDQDLVGRVFLVHDLAHASEKTARRVQCLERTDS